MKAILALHAEDLRQQLLDPDFHACLAVDRIQVNVDDEAVAPAMRLGPGPQITAVLSLWADDVATAIDVVRRLDPTVHAWAVTEREPLPPPPRVDGERPAIGSAHVCNQVPNAQPVCRILLEK